MVIVGDRVSYYVAPGASTATLVDVLRRAE
jgi:hypothetical protein